MVFDYETDVQDAEVEDAVAETETGDGAGGSEYVPASPSDDAPEPKDVRAEVKAAIYRFSQSRQVTLEPGAESMIERLFVRFARNPSPSWNVKSNEDRARHRRYTGSLISLLPGYLENILDNSVDPSTITEADVVEWWKRSQEAVCPYICPF